MGAVESPPPRRSASRQRLFFALWPDGRSREALAELARRSLRPRDGKAVPAENYHVTLVFLGSVDPALRDCAQRMAGALAVSPFELHLDQVGYWPRPRVLWTAPTRPPAELQLLVEALRRGLSTCGLESEKRPYRAHLTLARKVRGRRPESPHAAIVWPVDAFHLVESRTLRSGARYSIVQSWPLTGAAPTPGGRSVDGLDLSSPHGL